MKTFFAIWFVLVLLGAAFGIWFLIELLDILREASQ